MLYRGQFAARLDNNSIALFAHFPADTGAQVSSWSKWGRRFHLLHQNVGLLNQFSDGIAPDFKL